MKEELSNILVSFSIKRRSKVKIKQVFASLTDSLPHPWRKTTRAYNDDDTFLTVEASVGLEAPLMSVGKEKKLCISTLWLGIIQNKIHVLSLESFTLGKENQESYNDVYLRASLVQMFYIDILKNNKYFKELELKFVDLGSDANLIIPDIRTVRPNEYYAKKEQKRFQLHSVDKVHFGDKVFFVTSPNNVAIALSICKKNLLDSKLLYEKIICQTESKVKDVEVSIFYDYFEKIQTSIIFAYTAIEVFANSIIPDDYVHEHINDRKIKEVWSKTNIERWMETSKKLGELLPKILNSNHIKSEECWRQFIELEKLRNEIIHQKTKKTKWDIESKFLNSLSNKLVFEYISSCFKVIDFFYMGNEDHPSFPLGLGFAPYRTIEIENMDGFRSYSDEQID